MRCNLSEPGLQGRESIAAEIDLHEDGRCCSHDDDSTRNQRRFFGVPAGCPHERGSRRINTRVGARARTPWATNKELIPKKHRGGVQLAFRTRLAVRNGGIQKKFTAPKLGLSGAKPCHSSPKCETSNLEPGRIRNPRRNCCVCRGFFPGCCATSTLTDPRPHATVN